jgi:hypothetical protein
VDWFCHNGSLEVVDEGPLEVLPRVDAVWLEAFKPREGHGLQSHREVELDPASVLQLPRAAPAQRPGPASALPATSSRGPSPLVPRACEPLVRAAPPLTPAPAAASARAHACSLAPQPLPLASGLRPRLARASAAAASAPALAPVPSHPRA